MKKQLICSIVLFVIFMFLSCSPNAKDILKGTYEKCQSIDNGYYEMKKYLKLMSRNDTILISQSGYFKKISDSTLPFIFNSSLSSVGMGEINILYNGDSLAFYSGSNGIVVPKKDRENDVWQIYNKNPAFNSYLPLTYGDSRPVPGNSILISDKTTVSFIKEEWVNGVLCYHIKVATSPEFDYSVLKSYIEQVQYDYWISIQDSIPIQFAVLRDLNIDNSKLNEFERFVLTKYELNSLLDETILSLEAIPPYVKLEDVDPLTRKELLKIGEVAPTWSLASTRGDSLSLQGLSGKLVLLDFFYTSCPPCLEVLPVLQNLHEKYKDQGLQVVGISSLSVDTKQILEHFIEKHNINYPILLADQYLSELYNISRYPTVYLIDKEGRVLFQHIGSYRSSAEELERIIQGYINDNL